MRTAANRILLSCLKRPSRCGKVQAKPDPAGTSGETNEKPYVIWWYVLLALLVAAVIESVFAGKYMNPEQDQPIARKLAA